MKKNVFVKTFSNYEELNSFIDKNVGDDIYWKIRRDWITIDGLTVIVAMRNTKNFFAYKETCENNGFEYEGRKAV